MGALYIKNGETAELAREVADMLHVTKIAAVHDPLLHRRDALRAEQQRSIHERLDAWRAAHPLGEPTRREADKAFYDSLNDEDDQ